MRWQRKKGRGLTAEEQELGEEGQLDAKLLKSVTEQERITEVIEKFKTDKHNKWIDD